MRRKISWLCRRRKMLVYLPSRSLQWDQAQRNESCFWLQHIISRKIAKQWTYVRFGFDQSNQWSVNQIRARTDCNNGWHRVDVSASVCSKKHQNFLRFLWWQNNNHGCEPLDHQICVHVFGGASSANCYNSALKQTSNDNVEGFGSPDAKLYKGTFTLMTCSNRRIWRSCYKVGQECHWYVPERRF